MTYDLTWADEAVWPYANQHCEANFCWPWGAMRWLLPAMRELGMVFDAGYDWHKAWPSQDGLTDDDWDEEDPSRWTPLHTQYQAATEVILEKRFEYPGIPQHKFDSNDAWRIWPDEILSALTRYHERAGAQVWTEDWQRDSFMRWLSFLGTAAEHGGCIAH